MRRVEKNREKNPLHYLWPALVLSLIIIGVYYYFLGQGPLFIVADKVAPWIGGYSLPLAILLCGLPFVALELLVKRILRKTPSTDVGKDGEGRL